MKGPDPILTDVSERRLVTIQGDDVVAKCDLRNGAELVYLGVSEQNVLAAYDWGVEENRLLDPDPGISWLSKYRGGWQALVPNIGPAGTWRGEKIAYHGNWSRSVVDVVRLEPNLLTVTAKGCLDLRLTRTIAVLPGNRVHVIQELVNEGNAVVPFIWGEHPAFELEPGTKLEMAPGPVKVASTSKPLGDLMAGGEGAWPTAPGRNGGYIDISVVPPGPVERPTFHPDRKDGRVTVVWPLESRSHLHRMLVEWSIDAFPHAYLWTQIGGRGFPYRGRSRITAIELCSTWPPDGLIRAVQNSRAEWISPGEKRRSFVSVALEQRPSPMAQAMSS